MFLLRNIDLQNDSDTFRGVPGTFIVCLKKRIAVFLFFLVKPLVFNEKQCFLKENHSEKYENADFS